MFTRATFWSARLYHGSLNRRMFGRKNKYVSRQLANSSGGGGGRGKTPESQALHQLYQEQMMDLKAERELVFGFTRDEREAWTNASNHQHDPSFMEQIDLARETVNEVQNDQPTTAASSATSGSDFDHDPTSVSMTGLSHVTDDGQSIQMVNVADKVSTQRVAVAQARVVFPVEVSSAFQAKGYNMKPNELVGPKGPIFQCAKLAGIMAAKKTSDLIPLCHPLPLDYVDVQIELIDNSVAVIRCECRVTHKTGVEMEALTGASIAALTIYDMTKALSHRIRIEDTVLLSKKGGKREVLSQHLEERKE